MDSRHGSQAGLEVGLGKACLVNSARRCCGSRGCFYQHLALLAAGRMVGVGEFEQFNGRAVFDDERDADAVGWAVGRNQNFAASKLGGEISHFERNVRNSPDEIRDRRVRFETHPLHAKFTFLVADDKQFQVFQVGLARLHFSSGNSDVMILAHGFSLSVRIGSTLSLMSVARSLAYPNLAITSTRKPRMASLDHSPLFEFRPDPG